MATKIKRIKENINTREYKLLMDAVRGSETMRANTKQNLLRAFTILYYTGLRLNELQELRIKNIKELLDTGKTKVTISKTSNERKLYATDDFKKAITKVFEMNKEEAENRVITKGSAKNKRTGINNIAFISQVNKFIQSVLGDGYSSHSFRQGLITSAAAKGVNVKLIQAWANHSDVKTTLRYVKPSEEQIINSLIR